MSAERQEISAIGSSLVDDDGGVESFEWNINTLPDELLLLIFQHLENKDIALSVNKVCIKWKQLASDPELWKNRFIFYNSHQLNAFGESVRTAKKQIKHLHLGGHEAMEDTALQAVQSMDVSFVKQLSFLCSCRTNPSKVIKILKKFSTNLESLTLCLNDELVSYGDDDKTCYALRDSDVRPGILFNLIGSMENLKQLTLYGGCSTKWYFGEFFQSPGCNKIESLNLHEFEEFLDKFKSYSKLDLVQSLIIKNKDHLRSLKLSTACASHSGVRKCVYACQKSLKELSVNIRQLSSFFHGSISLTCLQLSGKFVHDKPQPSINHMIQNEDKIQELKELNFIQFDNFGEYIFGSIAKSLHCLQILRIDGNWLTTQNVKIVVSHAPLLEQICVRSLDTVAEKHFVSMYIDISDLIRINFDEIFVLDCICSMEKLKKLPLLSFNVIQTGCDCNHQVKNRKARANLDSEYLSRNTGSSRVIHLTLSNNLNEEFLSKFWDFYENDIIFHFNQ